MEKKQRKKPIRKKLTPEKKAHFREACRKTCLERYGDPNFRNHAKQEETKELLYGDKKYNNQEKKKQTCLERYGETSASKNVEVRSKISKAKKSAEVQQKYENTMLERYGATSPNLVPEIREKYNKTLFENYSVLNPLKNEEIKAKHYETMRQNGTFNTSKPEEELYQSLCEQYGADDIEREYNSDPRYPYKCDFYIKSEDLFIELNLHPSHGDHPFDKNNPEDIEKLEELKKKNDSWSNMIIDVWANRDVEKRQTAQKNNIKYKVIY